MATSLSISDAETKLKNKTYWRKVITFFFKPLDGRFKWHPKIVNGALPPIATKFQCQMEGCKRQVSVEQLKHANNFMQHLIGVSCCKSKTTICEIFDAASASTPGLRQVTLGSFQLTTDKAINMFNWIDFFTTYMYEPFSRCEDETWLKKVGSSLKAISYESLLKYMMKLMERLVIKIKDAVLNKLGVLIYDCWSDPYTKTHYMGLFVAIKHPTAKDKYGRSVAKFFLLALAPPQDETSFNARIWEEFIRTTCATYHINLADILYACSDNTALCPAIARL